jgi:hypothetical protein
MMPVIRISDETYAMLQQLGKPFEDTPDSVIARIAEAELSRRGNKTEAVPESDEVLDLDPETPPDLTHTRVRYARLGTEQIPKPNWNQLVRMAHTVAREHLGSFSALRTATSANIREGRYEDHGFTYLPEADMSIQGADSNDAWHHTFRLAKKLGLPVEVRFEWHDKEGAVLPGRRAKLAWTNSS